MHSYNVMFQVTHRDADLSGVGAQLGLRVNYSSNKGDLIETIPPSYGVSQCSGCNLLIDVQNADRLADVLKVVIETLKRHAGYLNGLADSGAKLVLFVGVGVVQTYICELLDWSLLKELSDLRVSVELTVCGPDADS